VPALMPALVLVLMAALMLVLGRNGLVAQMLCKRLKIGFFSLTLIGDLSKVAAVQQGIWFRRFLSLIITVQQNTVQQNIGDVSEWLKEHAWKVCIRQRIESSNLSVTAIFE
jgi:hypothetical protein